IVPNPDDKCSFVQAPFCSMIIEDTPTIAVGVFLIIQLFWVSMLFVVQLVQIAKAQTTFEVMHRNHSHAHGKVSALASAIATGGTPHGASLTPGAPRGADPLLDDADSSHSHRHRGGGRFRKCYKLLGIDAFVTTAQDSTRGERE